MFVVSLRLLQAITVILCLLVRHWRHFVTWLFWVLFGHSWGLSWQSFWHHLGPFGPLLASPGSLLGLFWGFLEPLGACRAFSWKMIALGAPFREF